jgi:hypothetical protein
MRVGIGWADASDVADDGLSDGAEAVASADLARWWNSGHSSDTLCSFNRLAIVVKG